MVEEPDSIVLVYLRRLDAQVGEMREDLREVKARLTNIEERLDTLNCDLPKRRLH
jgi:hypothetical protein